MMANRILVLFLSTLALGASAAARTETGRVSIETSPPGAEVWYSVGGENDRKYLGDSPIEYREIPQGRYDFFLTLQDHDSISLPGVEIRAGQHTQLSRDLHSKYSHLSLRTDPDSSILWLDGVKIGQSPYTNSLLLPGEYDLGLIHPSPLFKSSRYNLSVKQGDTVFVQHTFAYRDKNFMREHLSLQPWNIQAEAGFRRITLSGLYDSSGETHNFPLDSVQAIWDFPLVARLGLPYDLEIHLHLPFRRFLPDDTSAYGGPSDLRAGIKYTLREYNVGFDVSYVFGTGNKNRMLGAGHDALALSVFAMAAKDKLQAFGHAGYEFHFNDNEERKINPGDRAFAYLQAGYLLGNWMPYLGLEGAYRLDDLFDGKIQTNSGGHLVTPEVGIIGYISEAFSLQAGIPFTIIGKNHANSWGVHLSFALGLQI